MSQGFEISIFVIMLRTSFCVVFGGACGHSQVQQSREGRDACFPPSQILTHDRG